MNVKEFFAYVSMVLLGVTIGYWVILNDLEIEYIIGSTVGLMTGLLIYVKNKS